MKKIESIVQFYKMKKLTIQKILEEKNQNHSTRKKLFEKLERYLEKKIVAFFTSFIYPVSIEDNDAEMLEEVLQKLDLSQGLILMLNSPGGSALSAERIINICRTYSGTGEYEVIVPNKAKSAATMICLGASKILMSPTSELGPVDPQKVEKEEEKPPKWFSVYNLIESYKNLLLQAINLREDQKVEPFLQQLSFYDPREIEELQSILNVTDDIVIKALKTGMMKNLSENEIKEKIKKFLVPQREVKTHGRPIFAKEAKECGLNIEIINPNEELWKNVRELYVRLNHFVSSQNIAKCIETAEYSFHASI